MTIGVNFSVIDGKGARSSVQVNLPDGLNLVQVQDFVDDFAPILDAITDGAITGVSVSIAATLPGGLASTPGANSDVEEGARFIFSTENGYSTAVRVPTFPESKISSGSQAVNLADTAVDAFVDAMVAGVTVTAGTAEPSDYRGDDIVGVTSAVESFQRSRR